jgi:hypothetical protein
LRPDRADKKLTEAARLIATGRRAAAELTPEEVEDFDADLEAFGVAPDQRAQARAEFAGMAAPDEAFVVFAENVLAVRLFMALSTQWRITSLSTMSSAQLIQTGLDYQVVETTARLSGLGEIASGDFHRLQIMEAEALAAWREDRKARR